MVKCAAAITFVVHSSVRAVVLQMGITVVNIYNSVVSSRYARISTAVHVRGAVRIQMCMVPYSMPYTFRFVPKCLYPEEISVRHCRLSYIPGTSITQGSPKWL